MPVGKYFTFPKPQLSLAAIRVQMMMQYMPFRVSAKPLFSENHTFLVALYLDWADLIRDGH